MKPIIGKLYKRLDTSDKDVIVVTGIKKVKSHLSIYLSETIVEFYYLDDPKELCVWNLHAFQTSMEVLNLKNYTVDSHETRNNIRNKVW